MRGRRPKPTEVKRLEGNPGHRPLNENEPQPPTTEATFELPRELAGDDVALREWQRLVPMLRQARQITDADRAALIACCQLWSRYLDATTRITTSGGMVIRSPNGYPMLNPYLAVANKALDRCTKLWIELGLTPSSRSRVARSDGDSPPPGDEFAWLDEPRTH